MYAQSGSDYMVDYLGSITGQSDDSGSETSTFRYKPYGSRLSGGSIGRGFFWTGNTGSRSTGRQYAEQYNRARHYSSTTNQWISRDPLWPEESGYGYVRGNPVAWIDQHGLKACNEKTDCAKFPGGPCAYAVNQGALVGKYGTVICCDGKKFICTSIPNHLPPGITKCVKEHEKDHLDAVDCPPSGYTFAPYRDQDPSAIANEECAAYLIELKCLDKTKGPDCEKLKGPYKEQCLREYEKRTCELCRAMSELYKCSSMPRLCSPCYTK